jgi:hypothetical protein
MTIYIVLVQIVGPSQEILQCYLSIYLFRWTGILWDTTFLLLNTFVNESQNEENILVRA